MSELDARSILVVEDDENIRVSLSDNLEIEGYMVEQAATIAQAKPKLGTADLVLLDIMLPDGDGYEFCRWIRDREYDCLILMLTARSQDSDIDSGFEAGADDYLPKPYRMRELLLRVGALLRRHYSKADLFLLNDFVISLQERRIKDANGRHVHLTKKEFDLLAYLIENINQVLSREDILASVWGENVYVENRTVDNFILALKKQLHLKSGAYQIQSVRGVGYCLRDPKKV